MSSRISLSTSPCGSYEYRFFRILIPGWSCGGWIRPVYKLLQATVRKFVSLVSFFPLLPLTDPAILTGKDQKESPLAVQTPRHGLGRCMYPGHFG